MEMLTDDKEKIVSQHLEKMIEAHTRMLKLIDEAMRDATTTGSGNMNIFHQLKAALSFDKSRLLKVRPEDMLQYSKSWFETTQQNFNTIMEISKEDYSSLIRQIDEQFEIAKREIVQIDEHLTNVNDEKRNWLQRKKDEIIHREWDN